MSTLEQVAEFHRTFQHPILDSPQIPDEKRVMLRVNLLTEELKELTQAAADGDIVGVADALCDLQYVLSGAVLEFGLKNKFPALFNEVQRSNMSKACNTQEEADKTVSVREAEFGEPCHWCYGRGKYLIYRTRDMKTLKSINYSPANLKQFFNETNKENSK